MTVVEAIKEAVGLDSSGNGVLPSSPASMTYLLK